MFIQTEATPNPATLKFLPGRDVLVGEPRDFRTRRNGRRPRRWPPVCSRFRASPASSSAPISSRSARTSTEWNHIKPAILGVIMEHFLSGKPVIDEGGEAAETGEEFFEPADSETVEVIKELISTRVRPAVAMDGGDITFKGFRDGTVYLHMQGACSGCPSSTATLKSGIENLLRHFVPGVEAVAQV